MNTKLKILVYDDEQDVCFLFQQMLTIKGHEVVVKSNCNALFQDIETIQPDVIFMDNSMPGLSGYEATVQLKTTPLFSKIPVILCSGNWNAGLLAIQAKADYFLPKPFSMEDVHQSLHSVMRH